MQRAQELPIGAARGGFQNLHAAPVVLLRGGVVLQAVVHGAEIGERIDERAVAVAVLLFRERHHLLGDRQRFGVAPRVESSRNCW